MSKSVPPRLPQGDSLFESAFDYAAIGMAIVAPDGAWLRVNRAFCDFLGYTPEEFRQRKFQDSTYPEDLAADLAQAKSLLAGEIETYQMEKRYLHKNGNIVWGMLSVSLLRDELKQPTFFISQVQDITARKESEKRLDQAVAEIRKLQRHLVKICAWTKRIQIEGRWMTVDDFLRDYLRLNLTHGISIDGARLLKDEPVAGSKRKSP